MEKEKIKRFLLEGKVVLLPTDTIAGLACLPQFTDAVNKIFDIKNRPKDMFLPVMVSNKSQLYDLGAKIDSNASKLLDSKFVPGPLTIILGFDGTPKVPWLIGREEFAFRIPKDKKLREIMEETGPLFVTSANLHGSEVKYDSVNSLINEFVFPPDYVVDFKLKKFVPSTIINCRLSPPKVERIGVLTTKQIEKIINNE